MTNEDISTKIRKQEVKEEPSQSVSCWILCYDSPLKLKFTVMRFSPGLSQK